MRRDAFSLLRFCDESGGKPVTGVIRELVALGFFSGASLYLCPEGRTKRVMSLLCAALMTAAAMKPLGQMNDAQPAYIGTQLAELEERITQDGRETQMLLQRTELEKNCAGYIRNQAGALGIGALRVEIEFRQEAAGGWQPSSVRLYGAADEKSMQILQNKICEELGIEKERQEWFPDG